jgi:hypothetical protein
MPSDFASPARVLDGFEMTVQELGTDTRETKNKPEPVNRRDCIVHNLARRRDDVDRQKPLIFLECSRRVSHQAPRRDACRPYAAASASET